MYMDRLIQKHLIGHLKMKITSLIALLAMLVH